MRRLLQPFPIALPLDLIVRDQKKAELVAYSKGSGIKMFDPKKAERLALSKGRGSNIFDCDPLGSYDRARIVK